MVNEEVPSDTVEAVDDKNKKFEDVDKEAERIEAPRCTKCRRMTSGHEGPYGSKCDLKALNTEELKDDDNKKLEAKERKKSMKRKGENEDENEALKKKKKEEKDEEDRLNRAMKEKEKIKKKIADQRAERKQIEEETRKLEEDLDQDIQRNAKNYNRWRENQNPSSRMKEGRKSSNRMENERRSPRRNGDKRDSPRRSRVPGRSDREHEQSTPYNSRRSDGENRRRERSRYHDSQRMERDRSISRRDERNNPRRHHPSQRMEGERSRSGTRLSSRRMENSRIDEITISMVQAMNRVNSNDDKKIDPVPTWEESTSFEGWKKEVMIWSKAKGRPERKTQMLVEYLKKDTRKGMKELVVNEFIENEEFDYENETALNTILDKIKDFIDESKWNKTIKLVKDFKLFKQEDGEKNKEFVTRFTTFETRMKNVGTELPKFWLAAELVTRSKMNSLQKHNIMATIETEDSPNILNILKKKLRDLDACDEGEPKRTFFTDNSRQRSFDRRHGSNRGRSFSRDRNQHRSSSRHRDGRHSFQKDGRSTSRHRDGYGKPSFHKDGRSPSKHRDGHGRTSFQKDGRASGQTEVKENPSSGNTPKYTYHVTLKIDNRRSIFENEVENKALVDSGCPEMVAGLSWLKTFESSQGAEFPTVKRADTFKMGNDNFKTLMYKRIPVRIGELEEELEVGIIDTEIPLLISKKKLKEWGGRIDFQENTLYLRKSGETIHMEETSTGHLVINLSKDLKKDKDEAVKELFLMKKNREYNMKSLKKLHRVFGHPTEDKLKKLMDDAGIEDPNISRILKRIQECCRICQKYRKKQSRPKTGLPKARTLNEAVSLDLKPVSSLVEDSSDKRHIVYMMDEFSRYTAGAISKSKEPVDVAKIVLDDWCLTGMGYPSGYFFCDNGSEFKGNLLEGVAKKTGIKVKLTPSYSSWSNGGIERKHGAIDLTIKKLMEDDPQLKLEDALKHAIWSRNMEIGKFGFSPYQLAYGKSPFLPGISEGTILTDQSIPQEDIVRRHFINQEKARVEMRKAEANNRLKEAFNTRIQPYHDIIYQPGDEIIYLNKDDKWDGPAKVAGTESKTLHILQNGTMRKVAMCRARPWNENVTEDDAEEPAENSDVSQENEVTVLDLSSQLEDSSQLDDSETTEVTQLEDGTQQVSIQLEQLSHHVHHITDSAVRMETRPKRGSTVRYRLKGGDEVFVAKVKHVGRKASAKKNMCWLEENDSKRMETVDFGKNVDAWDYLEKSKVGFQMDGNQIFLLEKETEHRALGKCEEKKMEELGVFLLQRDEPIEVLATMVPSSQFKDPEVQQAMEEELEKWNQFEAYEVVEDNGQNRIDGRWIVNRKEEHDGLKVKVKARYCLRGFKEDVKPRSDSPTVDRMSTKILYAIAGNEGWKLESIDVTAAFLQGCELDREIYVTPPKEARMEGYLWKMKKAAYGLYDASRRWWMKVMEVLMELGGKTLVGDESLILFHKDGKLSGMISLHVDDFQGAGDDHFFSSVMNHIAQKFKISKREIHSFRFTGVDVACHENGDVTISQSSYAESLEKIIVDPNDDLKRPLSRQEFKQYRGLVGKLTWLSEMTRPDLSYDTLDLAGYNKEATVQNLKSINKVVDKAKKVDGLVRYSRIGDLSDLKILAISDGGLNRREERTQSVMGKTIFLSNMDETRVAPLLWKSKTIPTVSKSAKTAGPVLVIKHWRMPFI